MLIFFIIFIIIYFVNNRSVIIINQHLFKFQIFKNIIFDDIPIIYITKIDNDYFLCYINDKDEFQISYHLILLNNQDLKNISILFTIEHINDYILKNLKDNEIFTFYEKDEIFFYEKSSNINLSSFLI